MKTHPEAAVEFPGRNADDCGGVGDNCAREDANDRERASHFAAKESSENDDGASENTDRLGRI